MNHEILTVTSAAVVSLNPELYVSNGVRATQALLVVETAAIRFLNDGGTPTTAAGVKIVAGASINLNSHDEIKKFKMIAAASSATVTALYKG